MNSDYEKVLKASQLDKMKIDWVKEGKKQGALKELKRVYESISVFHAKDCIDLKLIEKRIKELEGEGVEK